jgi:Primase C terminal 2 (PriCT-2)
MPADGGPEHQRSGVAPRRVITLGAGVKQPVGRGVELDPTDPVGSLARVIADHLGLEAWWAGSTFRGNHRHGARWTAAHALGSDIDTPSHADLTPEQAKGLDALAMSGALPGNVYHRTPAGARLGVVLAEPITDVEMFERAATGFAALVAALVEPLGLIVDKNARDPARLFFTPNATAKGVKRRADVLVLRTSPITVEELLAHAPEASSPPDPPPAPDPLSDADVARTRAALRFIDADDRDVWLRVGMALHWTGDPRARDWWDEWSEGSPSKFDPRDQEKTWQKFSSNRKGRVVTLATLFALAREGGYTGPGVNQRAAVPDPEPDPTVDREELPLTLARVRAAEVIADASRHRRSLDLAGSAGLGKSTAAVADAIDVCSASNVTRGHPVFIFAIGGGLVLAIERLRDVQRLVEKVGATAEINVRMALGRQDLRDVDGEPSCVIDAKTAPNGFACMRMEEAGNQMQFGLAGCSGCEHRSNCTNTIGAYLHDWDEIRRVMRDGPTILVMTVAALKTYWARGGRHGKNVRVILDDADDVHAGALTENVLACDVIAAAWETARLAEGNVSRAGGLAEAIDNDIQRAPLLHGTERKKSERTADPNVVGRVLRRTLTCLEGGVSPARLGERLIRLARVDALRNYARSHSFDSSTAAAAVDRLGPAWLGLGVGALIWRLLREVIECGTLPTVADRGREGIAILSVDQHLRHVRKTRMGVAPLEPTIRRALGFDDVVEIIVPVDARTCAVKLPVKGSWGNRGKDNPSVADKFTSAIIDDVAAASPGKTLLIGGLADEASAASLDDPPYTVAVQGRDDRSTNAYSKMRAIVLRRLEAPFQVTAETVSAVLAGCGLPRPTTDDLGDLLLGKTVTGALLPLDPVIQGAYLGRRASALRNGVGRARAVLRPGQVLVVLLDQDPVRWPWLLPGYQIDVMTIDDLSGVLGADTPSTDGADAARRTAADPDPARTADRRRALAAAEADGALSDRQLATATGLTRSVVARLRPRSRTPRSSLKEDTLRKVRGDQDHPLNLTPPLVNRVSAVMNVTPRQVRKLLGRARLLAEGKVTNPRTIRAVKRLELAVAAVRGKK